MKRTFLILKLMTAAAFIVLAACSIDPAARIEMNGNNAAVKTAEYTVIFDSQGGTVPEDMTNLSAVSNLEAMPAEPEKPSYHFAGWFTMTNGGGTEVYLYDTILSNMTVYAFWSEDPVYRVTYFNPGESNHVVQYVVYPLTTVGTLPTAPYKTKYAFSGWFSDFDGMGSVFTAVTPVTEDTIVYAYWPSTPGLKYTMINGDTEYRVYDFTAPLTGIVIVPEYRQGKKVTAIGEYAFFGSLDMTSIVLPDGLTVIEDFAFGNCAGLTNMILPEGLETISDDAFYNCAGLTEILIPQSVADLGAYAFEECTGLTNMTVPGRITIINPGVFYDCTGMVSVTLPNCITSIGQYAFEGCEFLSNFTFPGSLQTIGEYAFYECDSMTVVVLPEGLTTIGDEAFFCLDDLMDLTVPSSIISIGNDSFFLCSNLTNVTINAVNPPEMGTISVDEKSKLMTIRVPAGSLEAYQTCEIWHDLFVVQ